jgi:hypothetical protein
MKGDTGLDLERKKKCACEYEYIDKFARVSQMHACMRKRSRSYTRNASWQRPGYVPGHIPHLPTPITPHTTIHTPTHTHQHTHTHTP